MPQVIEGKWEELVKSHDLRGRQVRVIVLDDNRDNGAADNPWLKSLRAWADSHEPIGHTIDDSREAIYSGTVDDPR